MKEIREKLEKRARIAAEADALLDRARAEGRELNAEEVAQFERMHADADALRESVARLERQRALELELGEAMGRRTSPEGPAGGGAPAAESRLGAFRSWLRGGLAGVSAQEARDLSAGTTTAGGYLSAPIEFGAMLLQAIDNLLWIRQAATKFKVSSVDGIGIPSLDADVADAAWTAEVDPVSADSSMTFGRRELKPLQLTKLVKVSRKLLRAAALDPVSIVAARLAATIGRAEEKAFLTGGGTTDPLGIFTASNDGIPTSRDVSTGNTATAPTLEGLLAAKYSLKAGYWPGARWCGSRSFVSKVAALRDGDGRPILALSDTAGMPDRLLGWPLMVSEYAPATFTSGLYVAVVGDFSYYWIADALTLEVQRLDELYAANSQVGFIGRSEVDGAPVLGEAFARVKLG